MLRRFFQRLQQGILAFFRQSVRIDQINFSLRDLGQDAYVRKDPGTDIRHLDILFSGRKQKFPVIRMGMFTHIDAVRAGTAASVLSRMTAKQSLGKFSCQRLLADPGRADE